MKYEESQKVTVAITSRIKSEQLLHVIKSVQDQKECNVDLVVIDDYLDPQYVSKKQAIYTRNVRWIKNSLSLGWYNNLRRAFEQNRSPFFAVLSDNDVIEEYHLKRCIDALVKNPTAAFAAEKYIDSDNDDIVFPSAQNEAKPILIAGRDWLHQIIRKKATVPHTSAVVFRSSKLKAVGGFQIGITKFGSEMNLLIRMAAKSNIIFLPNEGVRIGINNSQDKLRIFKDLPVVSGWAEELEIGQAIAILLEEAQKDNILEPTLLTTELLTWMKRQGKWPGYIVPNIIETERDQMLYREQLLADLLPENCDAVIVVRDDCRRLALPTIRQWPFMERKGEWNGNPRNDTEAISELERLRANGAKAIVFCESAVWQLDHYVGFRNHLHDHYIKICDLPGLVLFDISIEPKSSKL